MVSVFVNQTEASLNAQTYTAEVLFTVGTNVVTATATDAAGNTASSRIECYYRPSLASLVEYEYNRNGCLVGKAVDGTYYTVYEYDYENRLTRVTLPDASTNEFVYDGDKRRVSRKDASGDEKWFLYDGINILQDLATDGTVWTSYVQGIGIDKLIARTEWVTETETTTSYYLNFARQTGGGGKVAHIPVCAGSGHRQECLCYSAGRPPDGLIRAIIILRNIALINSDL